MTREMFGVTAQRPLGTAFCDVLPLLEISGLAEACFTCAAPVRSVAV